MQSFQNATRSFPANGFGLYDIHGNVWEWCQDNYVGNYNNTPRNGSPYINKSIEHIVLFTSSLFPLPQKKKTRPPTWSKREILDAILYQLKNGCNWGDLPQDFPPPSTVEAFNVKGIVRCGVQPLKVNPLQRVGYI